MAQLIQIGNHVVNLDLVTYVRYEPTHETRTSEGAPAIAGEKITLYLVGDSDECSFYDNKARALWALIREKSECCVIAEGE